jgi:hypothetical protein
MKSYLSLMGEDFVVEIDYRITSRGYPAKTCGPPEDCYPAEGPEYDIESITLQREIFVESPVTPGFVHWALGPAWEISDKDRQFELLVNHFDEQIWQHAADNAADDRDYDEDYYREDMRERRAALLDEGDAA